MNELGRKDTSKMEKTSVFTKETFGVVLILFSTLCLVCLISREKVFSYPGQVINAFFLGCFGYFAYILFGWLIYLGIILLFDKKSGLKIVDKVLITLEVILIALFSHTVSMGSNYSSFADYISTSYMMAKGGVATCSAGGFFTALMAYPLSQLLTVVGSAVVIGVLIAVIGYSLINKAVKNHKQKVEGSKLRSTFVKEEVTEPELEISGVKEYPIAGVQLQESAPKQSLFVVNPNEFSFKSKKDLAKPDEQNVKIGFTQNGLGVATYTPNNPKPMIDDFKKKIEYIKQPSYIDIEKTVQGALYLGSNAISSNKKSNETTVSDYLSPTSVQENKVEPLGDIPMFEHEETTIQVDNSAKTNAELFAEKYVEFETAETNDVENIENLEKTQEEIFRPVDDFKPIEEPKEEVKSEPEIIQSRIVSDRRTRDIFGITESPKQEAVNENTEPTDYTSMAKKDGNILPKRETPLRENRTFGFSIPQESKTQKVVEEPIVAEEEKRYLPKGYKFKRPPLDLLERREVPIDADSEDHEGRKAIIKQTLSEFKIEAEPQGHVQGPTITRYEIMMPAGISVKTVLKYDDDLKMRLASRYGIRIEAPIPGKNLVGIEVANKTKVPVGLREVMEGYAGQTTKPGSLIFALGKDIVGDSKTDNLSKGPHYLVAGATGSGKSVCLNVMIISLIMRYGPEDLRLILIDPKSVGFRIYEHLPHLLIDEIITEPQKALAVLQWAYDEMEKRYKIFADCGGVISDIDSYNANVANGDIEKMPRIVIVIDELADLMETCKKDMEARIRALAAKARAAGVHLVLATQRPSVDVITGTIKANLPSRIALKVMNFADSSTILSEGGAEKLLGNGDMLFKNSSMSETERYQGAWITDMEINNVVSFIKKNNEAYFNEDLSKFLNKTEKPKTDEISVSDDGEEVDGEEDNLFIKALWLAVNSGTVSISSLQRRFRVGFSRAGRLVDKMEEMGFISPNEGGRARRVLLSKEEFVNKYGEMPDAF